MATTTKIPTTVFSGFLGSGKTTIITHLVEELQTAGKQVIYIKNEIGDENVDGEIMSGKNIKTKELLNGCICCTLVGPFIQAIDEIIDTYQPDRIIIEASGAADPAAIALMIESQPRLQRDGVISVIDVSNFEGYKDLSITAQNQTKFTDLLVFNKVEQVDLARKRAVVGYVRELNAHSPVVEAPQGKLSAAVAFGVATTELDSLLKTHEAAILHDSDEHHHDHLEADGLESFHITSPGSCTQQALEAFLSATPANIYRIKGFVILEDNSIVIANKVGTRTSYEAAPAQFTTTENSLVFIGFSIAALKPELTQQLEILFKK